MLYQVDESLEAFLRATVPLGAADVDVSFEAPEREWSAKLSRPTVNAFLWDIRQTSTRARAGLETYRDDDGRVVRRMALPRVELRYLITAWTSDHGDERALLSGLMRAILAHGEIPEEYIDNGLAGGESVSLVMARSGEEHIDVFKTLEGQLKPGINVIVHAPVDTGLARPAGPPTEAIETSYSNLVAGTTWSGIRRVAVQVTDTDAIGAIVHTPHGKSVVNSAGQALVPGQPGDELVVETTPPLSATVPDAGGVHFP